jgi:hypothetical protein
LASERSFQYFGVEYVMSNKLIIFLTCTLSFSFYGSLRAHPLDSPDIVYIDGLPCNSACQSYMAWSRQTSMSPPAAAARSPQSSTNLAAHPVIGGTRGKPTKHQRIARQAMPVARKVPQPEIAALQPPENPVAETPAAKVADAPPAAAATTLTVRTVQEQVMAATVLAEHVTAAATGNPAAQREANNSDAADHTERAQPGEAPNSEAAPQNDVNKLVALLITRAEIKSVSDLDNKDIAIDEKQPVSRVIIEVAIAAAGAPEVRLNEGQAKPIDRVMSGEVPAALLTVVSPEAAEWFPDIKGFKIFRIPLSLP